MFNEIRDRMRYVFSKRPREMLRRESLALKLMATMVIVGLLREFAGLTSTASTIVMYLLAAVSLYFYPFKTLFRSAYIAKDEHQAFKKDARFSLTILAIFASFWIVHMWI